MRARQIVITASLGLALVLGIHVARPARGSADETAEVAKQCRSFKAAWNSHDAKAIASVFADDATHIDPWGKLDDGKAAIEKMFTEAFGPKGGMRDSTLVVHTEEVRFATSDMAVSDAEATVSDVYGPDGTKSGPMAVHVTNVWKKAAGSWWVYACRPYLKPAPAATSEAKLTVPAVLNVPAGNKLAFVLKASGWQIYTCKPKKDDATQFEWAFTAPEAQLTDAEDHAAGRHSVGPTWESTDGSKVSGKMEQKVDAPGATDIPWLLLSAKSNEGKGKFANVTFVQRLDTHGGNPPATGADATHAGKEERVEYKATYYFYVAGS